MTRTYSQIDLDKRCKIARWRMAGVSIDRAAADGWSPQIDRRDRLERHPLSATRQSTSSPIHRTAMRGGICRNDAAPAPAVGRSRR